MKAVLGVLCFIALHHTVTSTCFTCKYGTPPNQCTDPYVPSGPESDVCNGIIPALCRKYGDYQISCITFGSTTSCDWQGLCGGSGAGLASSSLVAVVAAIFFTTCIKH